MTDLMYLTDSYARGFKARVVSCRKKGNIWEIILDKTIFYPQGGGQLSDQGDIVGPHGTAHIKHVRMHEVVAVHEGSIEGNINPGEMVDCTIDWDLRFLNMRRHGAGHIVHEAVMQLAPALKPLRADHGKQLYIEYEGSLPIDKQYEIERKTNEIVEKNLPINTEMVSYDELIKRVASIAGTLPKNKPLRIIQIGDYAPMPDGGTQVKSTIEVGPINITNIENSEDRVRVYYTIESLKVTAQVENKKTLPSAQLTGSFLDVQREALETIESSDKPVDLLRLELLGAKSDFTALTKTLRDVPEADKQSIGIVVNQVKKAIEEALREKSSVVSRQSSVNDWFDTSLPGIKPPQGHLHIVTQTIMEITRIFERIGFTRVRHPEVDWDWYPFGSLNMPPNHPARDEWETFFIETSLSSRVSESDRRDPGRIASSKTPRNDRFRQIVLTPHTSNGQVREMEKGKLPIRMINIAKCYRRQIDVSHTPMFHQFEGLYVDKGVSITHLKGVFDYFVKQFYGSDRTIRLRPFHFQFTEPSFEVDINCGICLGTAKLPNGQKCRLCKEGWLEMAGSGMVHPVVLKNGGIDPSIYSGFAFGWGIERAYMMKSGAKIDDIRHIYSGDIRFLEQF